MSLPPIGGTPTQSHSPAFSVPQELISGLSSEGNTSGQLLTVNEWSVTQNGPKQRQQLQQQLLQHQQQQQQQLQQIHQQQMQQQQQNQQQQLQQQQLLQQHQLQQQQLSLLAHQQQVSQLHGEQYQHSANALMAQKILQRQVQQQQLASIAQSRAISASPAAGLMPIQQHAQLLQQKLLQQQLMMQQQQRLMQQSLLVPLGGVPSVTAKSGQQQQKPLEFTAGSSTHTATPFVRASPVVSSGTAAPVGLLSSISAVGSGGCVVTGVNTKNHGGDANVLGVSTPSPVGSSKRDDDPGHYSAFVRMLYSVSLKHVSLRDTRVRILLIVLRWLQKQHQEQVDPSQIFVGNQLERMILQFRMYMQLLLKKQELTTEQLLMLGISPSLGFKPNRAFIDAIRTMGSHIVNRPCAKLLQPHLMPRKRDAGALRLRFVQLMEEKESEAEVALQQQIFKYQEVLSRRDLVRVRTKNTVDKSDQIAVDVMGYDSRGINVSGQNLRQSEDLFVEAVPVGDVVRDVNVEDFGDGKTQNSIKTSSQVVQDAHQIQAEIDDDDGSVVSLGSDMNNLEMTNAGLAREKANSVPNLQCFDEEVDFSAEEDKSDIWDIGGWKRPCCRHLMKINNDQFTSTTEEVGVKCACRGAEYGCVCAKYCISELGFRLSNLQLRILQLRGFQKQVRAEVTGQRLLELQHPSLQPLQYLPVRTARKHRLLKLLRERGDRLLTLGAAQQQQRQQMLQQLLDNHRRNFQTFHREVQRQVRRVAAAVLKRRRPGVGASEATDTPGSCGALNHPHDCGCADKLVFAAAQRKARLDALKKHDEAAYLQLLQETKNERLLQLVRQTEDYMRQIGQLVVEQREREGLDMPSEDVEVADAGEGSEMTTLSSSFQFSKERYYRLTHQQQEKVKVLPKCLKGGTLRSYQMEGLNWLVSLHNNGLNGILADCMGLGKTVQTVSFLAYLHEEKKVRNPHLILAPLSTIHGNWRQEFKKWWPSLRLVVYEGAKEVRKALRARITSCVRSDASSTLPAEGVKTLEPHFDVLLTTDAFVLRDKSFLRKIQWEYLIVDEAHRLKNPNSKLVQTLNSGFQIKRRIALTGTPLQNDLVEVWALLNFLMPSIFNAQLNFEQWLNLPLGTTQVASDETQAHALNITEEEKLLVVDRLHKLLRPFLLRREKSEVADELPSKQEEIIWCPLSGVQKIEESPLGHNRMVQLRKVCNHPYLFCFNNFALDEGLVRCCGKFQMLDLLLPALKESGHRVLVFSQMTRLLDLLEVYLSLRGFRYLRLDGGTASEERQQRLQLYNQEGSPYFLFILSTKAGGLGVNLQSADTVIIFDSDWNPQNDEQAQCRAHRIGQKREVLTIRFITPNTIEEQILHSAELKLDKDALVIKSGMYTGELQDRESERQEQVREILRRRKQLEANLTRPFDISLLSRQLARSPKDTKVFELVSKLRKLLHTPSLIRDEVLPPCLFQWSKTSDRVQVDLVEKKQEALFLWRRVYVSQDFWIAAAKKRLKALPPVTALLVASVLSGKQQHQLSVTAHQGEPPANLSEALQSPIPAVNSVQQSISDHRQNVKVAEAATIVEESAKEEGVCANNSEKGNCKRGFVGDDGSGCEKDLSVVEHGIEQMETSNPILLVDDANGHSSNPDSSTGTANASVVELSTADATANSVEGATLQNSYGFATASSEALGVEGPSQISSAVEVRSEAGTDLKSNGVNVGFSSVIEEYDDESKNEGFAYEVFGGPLVWIKCLNEGISMGLEETLKDQSYEAFVSLPNKNIYKDYFEKIKKPTCLLNIKKFSDKGEFTSLGKLEKMLARLASNAQIYNGADSPIFLKALECIGQVMASTRYHLCMTYERNAHPQEATKIKKLFECTDTFRVYSDSVVGGSGNSIVGAKKSLLDLVGDGEDVEGSILDLIDDGMLEDEADGPADDDEASSVVSSFKIKSAYRKLHQTDMACDGNVGTPQGHPKYFDSQYAGTEVLQHTICGPISVISATENSRSAWVKGKSGKKRKSYTPSYMGNVPKGIEFQVLAHERHAPLYQQSQPASSTHELATSSKMGLSTSLGEVGACKRSKRMGVTSYVPQSTDSILPSSGHFAPKNILPTGIGIHSHGRSQIHTNYMQQPPRLGISGLGGDGVGNMYTGVGDATGGLTPWPNVSFQERGDKKHRKHKKTKLGDRKHRSAANLAGHADVSGVTMYSQPESGLYDSRNGMFAQRGSLGTPIMHVDLPQQPNPALTTPSIRPFRIRLPQPCVQDTRQKSDTQFPRPYLQPPPPTYVVAGPPTYSNPTVPAQAGNPPRGKFRIRLPPKGQP